MPDNINPELCPLSKLWCNESYTFVTGQVKLRSVCTQQEKPPHTELVDDYGDGISYHEVSYAGSPAVYKHEHLTKIIIDSSNLILGYTNWGAVYEIGQYISTINGIEQKVLDTHNLIDENVDFYSREEVVIAFASNKNIEILTKKNAMANLFSYRKR